MYLIQLILKSEEKCFLAFVLVASPGLEAGEAAPGEVRFVGRLQGAENTAKAKAVLDYSFFHMNITMTNGSLGIFALI